MRSLNFGKNLNHNMYILWNQTWDTSWKMIYTDHFFPPLTMMMMPSYTLLCFQLMRQIDLMVSAKKAEWETHVHAVQIQLDKKTKEVEFVKVQLEQKCQEVSVLYWLFSSFINENTSFVMKVQQKNIQLQYIYHLNFFLDHRT